jgi:hypothetical protein
MKTNIVGGFDERLEKAIDRANYQVTLNNQKQNARLKLDVDLTFAIGGGLFKISPELISFVQTLIAREHSDAIILDVNKNPINIENLSEFQEAIIEKYYQAMNDYMTEFSRIRKSRKTSVLVE